MAYTTIRIPQGDDNLLRVKLYTQQDEGVYYLHPEEGSSVTFYVRDKQNNIVQEETVVITAETEDIEFKVRSSLPSGCYNYSLFYNYADGELHTLIPDGQMIIEE